MIDQTLLLDALRRHLPSLEADLLERCSPGEHPDGSREQEGAQQLDDRLRGEWRAARDAERTAETFRQWRGEQITQSAVAWMLACVFLRFLEDNHLLDAPTRSGAIESEQSGSDEAAAALPEDLRAHPELAHAPWLAGPAPRAQSDAGSAQDPRSRRLAAAEEATRTYFRARPAHSERDYLLFVLDQVQALPGLEQLFAEHNPLWRLEPSGDACKQLLALFRERDPETLALRFDFTDLPPDHPLAPAESNSEDARPGLSTRFLGDLYQDLSETARKRYALLQTPEFVEAFLLDQTFEPAVQSVGIENVTVIDPTCGSGHFLLGALRRLLERRLAQSPGSSRAGLAAQCLEQVAGVDLNPFATAIARFRLLVEVLRFAGIRRLAAAPALDFNVATGDSLLHGPSFHTRSTSALQRGLTADFEPLHHHFESEDADALGRILGRQYHVVVGNPPYITGKDAKLRDAYRARYSTCHGKFSLGVPFTERFFDLALSAPASEADEEGPTGSSNSPIGYVGMITTNAFMKREFGKKLIETFFRDVDLTHVVDTSGAYIPGHGTPTVVLVGRNRPPVSEHVRAVLGIRGEPSTPEDPAHGLVWTSILEGFSEPGFENDFVSVADRERGVFTTHPWSLQGGAAPEILEVLAPRPSLAESVDLIGVFGMTNADDIMLSSKELFARVAVPPSQTRPLAVGDELRDWNHNVGQFVVFPYRDGELLPLTASTELERYLWPARTTLGSRATFSKKTYFEEGRPWWEWHQVTLDRLRIPLSITFAFVATHNHFVLDRGGKVFNRSAPVIKLPEDASLDDHLALLGVLNSSTVGFWVKQVSHNKGTGGIGGGISSEEWEKRIEINGTRLKECPLPFDFPTERARQLDALATELQSHLPDALVDQAGPEGSELTAEDLTAHRERAEQLRAQRVFLQEELDWWCYAAYGLLPSGLEAKDVLYLPVDAAASSDTALDAPPLDGSAFGLALDGSDTEAQNASLQPVPLQLSERAFEIALARRVAAGTERTAWFERHRSTPVTELPEHWPAAYREVVERRLRWIGAPGSGTDGAGEDGDRFLKLLERPEHKRRWSTQPWEKQQQTALERWLLARLEDRDLWPAPEHTAMPQVLSAAQLTDRLLQGGTLLPETGAARAKAFRRVAALVEGRSDIDLVRLVTRIAKANAVPAVAALRYKPKGLAKHEDWKATWELQRQEDAITARTELRPSEPDSLNALDAEELRAKEVGTIPVPPKYTSADFLPGVWTHRGKLDVPKEAFVSFPGSERPLDDSPLLAWAGWDHHQLTRALVAEIQTQSQTGASEQALLPLLVALHEQLPWVAQWHDDGSTDQPAGALTEAYRSFVTAEARKLGRTVEDLEAWRPEVKKRGRKRKKK